MTSLCALTSPHDLHGPRSPRGIIYVLGSLGTATVLPSQSLLHVQIHF